MEFNCLRVHRLKKFLLVYKFTFINAKMTFPTKKLILLAKFSCLS